MKLMRGRLTLKGLDDGILASLGRIADKNERSLEAEARYALSQWVKTHDDNSESKEDEISSYQTEVTSRLNYILRQHTLIAKGHTSYSLVAEKCGYESPLQLENWLRGKDIPSYKELEKLATYFGVNETWLKNGSATPYNAEYIRISKTPDAAVEWLTSLQIDGTSHPIEELSFVRTANGSLYITKKYQSHKCLCYSTPYVFSDGIGNSGFRSLQSLFKIWKSLYTFYIKNDIFINSYILNEAQTEQWTESLTHPLCFLVDANKSAWWEDVWEDRELHEYWEGCQRLSERVRSANHS
ncbi:helix-turn-helix domain-containing protein [Candidatus Enterovibrio escicola]|uniref:helix-turn-helix domain-containing protein n=1 Tax=Candidatus Enterovibrio escicola TaxID=1927127 RepID=UPI0016806D00|nr:helix-turn-helix transcriptional regulator [Candidatus Enterovibrio escacola]